MESLNTHVHFLNKNKEVRVATWSLLLFFVNSCLGLNSQEEIVPEEVVEARLGNNPGRIL